jgi:hypothetical protein
MTPTRKLFRGALMASVLLLPHTGVLADAHALIMTIGDYRGGITPLRGVRHDATNARKLANRMGVRDENIIQLSDSDLTLDGVRAAFDRLQARVRQNDRVFIYYSGHGGRSPVPGEPGRCAESLITVDGKPFMDTEFEHRLKAIGQTAEKVIVLVDACHSGGVTTRAVRHADAPFVAKYWPGADECRTAVNRLTRSLKVAAKSPGSGAQNYVYIAAAQANEVSLDEPSRGGLATQAWLSCMSGQARDTDGSGAITAEEIRQCAQAQINRRLAGAQGFLPHHIVITGNADAVLSLASSSVPAPAAGGQGVNALATLTDIYNRRDDRRQVTLVTGKPSFRIGQDNVEFKLTSSHAGYVYLLMVGSDGKTFDMLFPNKLDLNNRIEAGQTLELPRRQWEVQAGGPAGKNQLLAIVADSPRDFSKLGMQPAGPFSVAEATPVAAKDIVLVSLDAPNTDTTECRTASRRNLKVKDTSCSSAYGAALTTVLETN